MISPGAEPSILCRLLVFVSGIALLTSTCISAKAASSGNAGSRAVPATKFIRATSGIPDPGAARRAERTATGGRPLQRGPYRPNVSSTVRHLEYVFPEGGMYVYDIDHGHKLVKSIRLPQAKGIRGAVASPATRMLYISYGGDGGSNGNGSMLEYNLITDKVLWTKHYSSGIDSMAITPDGKTIYMPDGELSSDGKWYVIDAKTGNDTGAVIDTGLGTGDNGPHNTVVSLNGKYVYMGDRNLAHSGSNYIYVAIVRTNRIVKKIGPFKSGIRPFTVNRKGTIVYTSVTGFLGFQVGDITTGRVLYTVPINGFHWDGRGPSDPSHGISLSPNEKELYVIDWPNSYVHVFDVTGVPARPPKQVADIRLSRSMNHEESPCSYDCLADGWLQHSRDGRFVYVGDAGDVIDTSTRKPVINLPALYNTRKHLEIDWKNNVPYFTTSRTGLGYGTQSRCKRGQKKVRGKCVAGTGSAKP